MTEEQKQAITREAEEKYPFVEDKDATFELNYNNYNRILREAYVAGCSSMVERMEELELINLRQKEKLDAIERYVNGILNIAKLL